MKKRRRSKRRGSKAVNEEDQSEEEVKPVRKSQGQILQEALGLGSDDLPDVEKKLFIARFLDYFSEETLDFVYKDRSIESYKKEITEFLESVGTSREEDKLLKISFENKEIMEIVYRLKKRRKNLHIIKEVLIRALISA